MTKNYFHVAQFFEAVEARLRSQLPKLTPCPYPIGVWHVIGRCGGRRTNYLGIDVAREFPGAIGIQVFLAATSGIGEDVVMALREQHEWQWGHVYYPDAKDDRHRVHTNFLIPSLDYWERHQGDFVKLAADINAAI